MELNADNKRLIDIYRDPVKWAEFDLGWKARWYQAEIIRNPSKRIVARLGRRSGKTACMEIKMLHFAATHPGSKQVVVTPYESQVALIFSQMQELLNNSKVLGHAIKSHTKTPHYYEFTNGAQIRGFTSGVSSSKEAASLRGQKADWIFMDECVPGNTMILTPYGEVPIRDIEIGEKVVSINAAGKPVIRNVIDMKCTGSKEVLIIKTDSGLILKCTPNHPLLTSNGYVAAEDAEEVITFWGEDEVNGNIFVDKIVSKKIDGIRKVYNLTVEGDHNYIANGFVTHNCDYMSDKDFDTVFAIAMEDPERIGVWASSTPSGRRGSFYKICTNKSLNWTEFHYPTSVVPNWSPSMENELMSTFSGNSYQQEILAEFGSQESGVFNKDAVDAAKFDYNYVSIHTGLSPKILGVDWDKYGAGTQLVVMEYDLRQNKFIVLQRKEIPKGEFTLSSGVESVVEFNQLYRPDFIYVDRGYGEHQVETLHKYGIERPDTGLKTKVIGASFQEVVSVRDPFTQEMTKHMLKPFIINQLEILFEQNRMMININDIMMCKELQDFAIKHISPTGTPVYEDGNDHTISALLLCIYGFYMKFPQFMHTVPIDVNPTHARYSKASLYNYPDQFDIETTKQKETWDEPGTPPPVKIRTGSRTNSGVSSIERGAKSQSTVQKGFQRKFW